MWWKSNSSSRVGREFLGGSIPGGKIPKRQRSRGQLSQFWVNIFRVAIHLGSNFQHADLTHELHELHFPPFCTQIWRSSYFSFLLQTPNILLGSFLLQLHLQRSSAFLSLAWISERSATDSFCQAFILIPTIYALILKCPTEPLKHPYAYVIYPTA